MEQVIKVTGLCLTAALSALFLKRGNPELALTLAIAAACVTAALLAEPLAEVLRALRTLPEEAGLSGELFVPLYKTVGIALVVKVSGSLCRDAGESALAAVLEMTGAVCALLVAMPLLQRMLGMLLELMNG